MDRARRIVAVEGRAVAYLDEGPRDASPVLLLHGAAFDHAGLTWQVTTRALRDRFRVIVPDLPGYGGSAGFHAPHDLPRLGRWSLAFLDAIGVERADVAGVSLGGGMALWLAIEAPQRVRRLVPVGAYGLMARLPFHPLARLALRAGIGPLVYRAAGRSRLLARAGLAVNYRDAWRVDRAVVDELMAVSRDQAHRLGFLDFLAAELEPGGLKSDLRNRLGAIACPTLLVHGSADKIVPVRHARAAAPRIAGARYLELPTGHWPMRERPDLFDPAVAEFLAQD